MNAPAIRRRSARIARWASCAPEHKPSTAKRSPKPRACRMSIAAERSRLGSAEPSAGTESPSPPRSRRRVANPASANARDRCTCSRFGPTRCSNPVFGSNTTGESGSSRSGSETIPMSRPCSPKFSTTSFMAAAREACWQRRGLLKPGSRASSFWRATTIRPGWADAVRRYRAPGTTTSVDTAMSCSTPAGADVKVRLSIAVFNSSGICIPSNCVGGGGGSFWEGTRWLFSIPWYALSKPRRVSSQLDPSVGGSHNNKCDAFTPFVTARWARSAPSLSPTDAEVVNRCPPAQFGRGRRDVLQPFLQARLAGISCRIAGRCVVEPEHRVVIAPESLTESMESPIRAHVFRAPARTNQDPGLPRLDRGRRQRSEQMPRPIAEKEGVPLQPSRLCPERCAGRFCPVAARQLLRQRGERLHHDCPQRKPHTVVLFQTGDQLHGEQRVTAEVNEAIHGGRRRRRPVAVATDVRGGSPGGSLGPLDPVDR